MLVPTSKTLPRVRWEVQVTVTISGGEIWPRKPPLVPPGITGTDPVDRWSVTRVCDVRIGDYQGLGGPGLVAGTWATRTIKRLIHRTSICPSTPLHWLGRLPFAARRWGGQQEQVSEKPKCCVGDRE